MVDVVLMSDDERNAVIENVVSIPLHKALGVRLVDPERPAAGIEIDVGDLVRNPSGVLHGGVVPMLLDVACYLAVMDELESGTHAVTVNVTASLLSSVPAGETVRFVGHLDRRGRSLVFLTAQALHGDRVVATGQLVKSIVSGPAVP